MQRELQQAISQCKRITSTSLIVSFLTATVRKSPTATFEAGVSEGASAGHNLKMLVAHARLCGMQSAALSAGSEAATTAAGP